MDPDDGSINDTLVNLPPTVPAVAGPGPAGAPLDQAVPMYTFGALIGSGGMGEVLLARDRRIGRDVAIKRLRESMINAEAIARFMREAKIQARLDHPAIVPVHEVGLDVHGRPYFTMKRLTGTTLAAKLAAGSPAQPLLRAFADVCLAIDLAHSRGVIHRDLKPANIMLGDFGEVYVIDWGLARSLGDAGESGESGGGNPTVDQVTDDSTTLAGTMLGTPGYMAPEQIHDSASAERPADVYALGAILFEILTGEALHPPGEAALLSTTDDKDCSPARRCPEREVPPELDALCCEALALEPAQRPTAHDVAVRVQAYLDGGRDLARRRALANDELARAHAALAANRRVEAMRAGARALALDPNGGAAELVTRLLLEPPSDAPAELRAAIHEAEAGSVRRHAVASLFGFIGMLAFTPLLIWNGVRNWPVVLGIIAVGITLVIETAALWRRPYRSSREMFAYLLTAVLLLPLVGRISGPLLLAPGLACLVTWAALMYPQLARHPWLVLAMSLAGWLVPTFLESVGAIAQTWWVEDGLIKSASSVIDMNGTFSVMLIFGGCLLTIIVAAFHGATLARTNAEAQQRLVAQAWHLQQLLPAPIG